jgi:hypothetical protein
MNWIFVHNFFTFFIPLDFILRLVLINIYHKKQLSLTESDSLHLLEVKMLNKCVLCWIIFHKLLKRVDHYYRVVHEYFESF